MTHYVCTGECHGESQKPGTCQAKDCSKYGEPLTPCHCEDRDHSEAYEENGGLENLELEETEDEM